MTDVDEQTPLLVLVRDTVNVNIDANIDDRTNVAPNDLLATTIPSTGTTAVSTTGSGEVTTNPIVITDRPTKPTIAATTSTTTTATTTISATTATFTSHKKRSLNNRSPYLQQKVEEIELLLSQPEIDLWRLREFAISPGGLVSDGIRKRAWPKLVGLDHNYDPLPLDELVLDRKKNKQNPSSSSLSSTTGKENSVTCSQSQSQSQQQVPTIEIDAHHELLKNKKDDTNSMRTGQLPPASTLIVESMDTAQIDRDVARCTWHLLTGSQRSRRSQRRSIKQNSTRGTRCTKVNRKLPQQNHHSTKYKRSRKVTVLLKKKQNRLANLINLTLVQSYDRSDGRNVNIPSPNRLRYYQGYHDVACIFLHALGGAGSNKSLSSNNENGSILKPSRNRIYRHYSSGDLELPSKVLCQVSFSHFSDALRSDFLRLQTGLKLILFPLLSKIDREVHDHLLDADMEPFFCLSWILTWFSHDIRDTALVKRLFDAFLVGHPALPIYTSLAMMTHPYNRQMIMETDCDFAALHQCLASLPKHSCKVGYKAQKVDGFDNIMTYVSDDEGDEIENESFTVITNTDTYLDEQESEFDDNDSQTFDTRSNFTNESIYTESSFPMSVTSNSQLSNTVASSGICKPTSISTTGGSLASGSMASLQEPRGCEPPSTCPTDRTIISTEEPDFSSKESTLVSGNWNEPWGSDINDGNGTSASYIGDVPDAEKADNVFVVDDHNPVPFESVLDTALQLIMAYPPSSLVALAKAYYKEDWESQLSLLSSTSTQGEKEPIDVQELIGLLQPDPPAWAILPSCASNWIDKKRHRKDLGLKPTSRKDRRRRKQTNSVTKKSTTITTLNKIPQAATANINKTNDSIDPMDYVRSNPEDRVVAAIGYGPGMKAKIRERKLLRQQFRRRKRRRALIIGCGVVVIGALVLYGGLKIRGGNDCDERMEKPAPQVRQLRADPSSGDNTKGVIKQSTETTARIRKANNVTLPRLELSTEELSQSAVRSSDSKTRLPDSPGRTKMNSSYTLSAKALPLIPKVHLLSTSPTSTTAPSNNLPARINPNLVRSMNKNSGQQRAHYSLSLAKENSPILKSMVRKTKNFLTRFAHHLWIVCHGFVFPFRSLQHRRSKLEY